MPDKKSRTRAPRGKRRTELEELLSAQLDDAKRDLQAIKDAHWQIIRMGDLGPEELAVGLALIACISSAWPSPYTCHPPTLAAYARTDEATVRAALDAFQEAGVLMNVEG